MSKKSLLNSSKTLFIDIYFCSSLSCVCPFNRRFLDFQLDFAKIREIHNNMDTKKYN
jgi:hypothetical protein